MSSGVSETMLGKALKGRRSGRRHRLQGVQSDGRPAQRFGHVAAAHQAAVEDSLRRLQTDYIDIYYIHHVDIQTPLEEMLRAFDDLVRQGKILYTACSNFEAWRLMEALWLARSTAGRASRPTSRNTAWWCATSTRRSCRPARPRGWASSPGRRSPAGYLAGKYKPGDLKAEGTRSAEGWGFQSRFFAPNHAEILQTLLDTAREINRSPAQTALRWVMDQPFMTSAIVGARNAAAARRDAGRRRLAPAGRGAGEARQGVGPAAPLSARLRGADGRRAAAVKMPSLKNAGDGATPSTDGR